MLFISFSLPELSRTILGVLVICALTFLCMLFRLRTKVQLMLNLSIHLEDVFVLFFFTQKWFQSPDKTVNQSNLLIIYLYLFPVPFFFFLGGWGWGGGGAGRVGGLIVIAMFILYLIFVLNLFCPLFRMLLLNVTHTNITHFSHSVCGFRHSWHQKYYLFLIWRNHLHSVSSKYYHLRKYVLSGLTSIIHCPQHLLQADGLERMNTVLLQHRPIWS